MGANSNIDYGAALGAFYQGYKDKQQLALQQQQQDYLYPKDLYVTPPLPQVVGGGPPINQLSQASRIGAQNRVNEAYALPNRPLINSSGQAVTPPNVQQPPQYNSRGASYSPQSNEQYADQSDLNRSPAGGQMQQQGQMNPISQAIQGFSDGTIARRMGLQVDPQTGGIHGPGRQVEEYNKLYLAILNGQSGILAAAERPAQQQQYQVLPPPKEPGGKGSGGDRYAATLRALEADISSSKSDVDKANAIINNPMTGGLGMANALSQRNAAEKKRQDAEAAKQQFMNGQEKGKTKRGPQSVDQAQPFDQSKRDGTYFSQSTGKYYTFQGGKLVNVK